MAQTTPRTSSPQPHSQVDGNGVDLIRGTLNLSDIGASIGGGGHGMSYARKWVEDGWRDDYTITAATDNQYVISWGGSSIQFTNTGNGLVSTDGTGATLDYVPNTGGYKFTAADGTVVLFDNYIGQGYTVAADLGLASSVTKPNGERLSFSYKTATICNDPTEPRCPAYTKKARLVSVVSNAGYQLKYQYALGSVGDIGDFPEWLRVTQVTLFNTNVDACSPSADSCNFSRAWPTVAFGVSASGANQIQTSTDTMNRTTTYTLNGYSQVIGIRRPTGGTDNVTITYDANGRVASLVRDGVQWTYGFSDNGNIRTTTVTDALGHQRVVTSDTDIQRITSDKDALGNTTAFGYDANSRLTEVDLPETGKVLTGYDGRGNVVSSTMKAKSGSGAADIVTTAGYDATCTNVATCNSPNWSKDANGNQTDYSYNASTGQIANVTAPAPTSGAVRPQVRYAYTSVGGISVLTGVSRCKTQASCAGSSDEVNSGASYNANLLPTGSTAGAGDGSLTASASATYDAVGNALTATDALGNVTAYRYDADREMVGAVGPDPDGSGGNPNPAVRMTYNADGQVTLGEQGTVASQSDSDWNSFSSHHQIATMYDAAGRKAQESTQGGGATSSLVQYSYDILGRLDCSALRMNPAAYGSLPGVCDLGTQGSFGPDRISRNEYDALNRVNKAWNGYRTADAAASLANYTPDGKAQTVTDENGNVTTYEYDGFDRLYRTRYPNVSGGGSSGSDYEQTEYDPAGNLSRRWLRGTGNHQDYAYDALNRLTGVTVPHLNATDKNTSYAYDNLGQLTSANEESNRFASFGYDALGRKITETSNAGRTKMFGYDLAGRRTKLTWQDGFFVTYGYDNAGRMIAAYDNAGTQLFYLSYNEDGLRTALCPNGTAGNQGMCTQYGYDTASRLTGLNLLGSSGTNMTFGGYNSAGQIGQRQNINDAYAWTGATNANKGYAVNGLNQYTSIAGGAIGYDPHGNLTGLNGSSYSYDSFNRLGEYNGGQSAGNWLYYDGIGRLEWSNATQTRFDYDGAQLLTELDGNNAIRRRYVYGPNPDEPVVWYEGSSTSDKQFLQTDERGSVVRVQRADGSTLSTNSYDEYGVPGNGNQGRFGYTGQTWLPDLGLWYYKARMYAPSLGRFMQTDPIGYADGLNRHTYAHADPVNRADPSGLAPQVGGGNYSFQNRDGSQPGGSANQMPDPASMPFLQATINMDDSPTKNLPFLDFTGGIGSVGNEHGEPDSTVQRAPLTEPPKILHKAEDTCSGPVRALGINVTGIFGLGLTFSFGSYHTAGGASGFYFSGGGGAGADVGVTGVYTHSNSISSFSGYSESAGGVASIPFTNKAVGGSANYNIGSDGTNVQTGYSVYGSGVPGLPGIAIGASATATETHLLSGACAGR